MKKILLVDHSGNNASLFERALDHTNVPCDMTIARTHDEAESTVVGNEPCAFDLIVIGDESLEVLHALRAGATSHDVPIVVFSESEAVDVTEVYRSGASAIIAKPAEEGHAVEAAADLLSFWLRHNLNCTDARARLQQQDNLFKRGRLL